MEFIKVTISLPKNLYKESIALVDKGLFSNFSDLVRSGIRNEFIDLQDVSKDFDKRYIYNDKKLVAGVKQSMKEFRKGKGKLLKSDKEVDEYLKAL